MPTYIRLLSKVPFKAVPISYALIFATDYLLTGGEITALKLAAIGFALGFFLPAIGSAKGINNHSENNEAGFISFKERAIFWQDSLVIGGIIGGIAGAIIFGLTSKVLSV